MEWHGLLGNTKTVPTGGGTPILLLDATAAHHAVASVILHPETVDGQAVPAGQRPRLVATLEWFGESVKHTVTFDVGSGVVLSVAGKRVRVEVRNFGTLEMRVGASVAEGVRPAARELQLTAFGTPILGDASQAFNVPNFAAWVEVYRADEASTALDVDFGTSAGGLYTLSALQGERLPRAAIPNGATLVTVRNPLPDKGLQPVDVPAVTPTLIWGLWV